MTERTTPTAKVSAEDVFLRPVEPSDVPIFFAHASDPEALRVAAFAPAPPADLEAYRVRWSRLLSSADTLVRTVVHDGNVVGHLISFPRRGRREVGGWFARASWGRGIATASLRAFLLLDPIRPLHARAAAGNLGALRVLDRDGFRRLPTEWKPATKHGGNLDEVVCVLGKSPTTTAPAQGVVPSRRSRRACCGPRSSWGRACAASLGFRSPPWGGGPRAFLLFDGTLEVVQGG